VEDEPETRSWWKSLLKDANESARKAVEAHWAAGRSTYSGALGPDAHKLFEHTPDGEVFEIRREGIEYVRIRKVEPPPRF
jgi:hypothetical protein